MANSLFGIDWATLVAVVTVLGALCGAIVAIWKLATWKSSLDHRMNQMNQINNSIDNINRWKNEISPILELVKITTMSREDSKEQLFNMRHKDNKIGELIKLLSSNPISKEEREKFNNYRKKAMLGKAFTVDEYKDFKLLADKFGRELPEDEKEEFDNLMSDLFKFILGLLIEKTENKEFAELERIEVREINLDDEVSGELSKTGDAAFYMLKEVGANGELRVKLQGPSSADFDLYIKFGSKPTSYDWDYRGYTADPEENVTIFPTKRGDYYIMVRSYNGSGYYKLKANAGYLYLRTTSFLRERMQDEFQKRTGIKKTLYDIRAIVDSNIEDLLAKIDRVEYHLHPTYPKERQIQIKTKYEDKFQLKDLAWGGYTLKANVYLKGLGGPVELQARIKLEKSGPRLLPHK